MSSSLALENLISSKYIIDLLESLLLNILYSTTWKNKNNPTGKFKENLIKQQTVFLWKREKKIQTYCSLMFCVNTSKIICKS